MYGYCIRLACQLRTVVLIGLAMGPLIGCTNLEPAKLNADGLCTTYLKGQRELPVKVGEIKIKNEHTDDDTPDIQPDPDAVYDLTVNASALERYDFHIDGGSINNNFFDAGDGMVRFGGSVDIGDMACIEVFLMEDIMSDVEDQFMVEFFNPAFPDSVVKKVNETIKVAVRTEEKFGDARIVPGLLGPSSSGDTMVASLMGLPVGAEIPGSAEEQGTQVATGPDQIFAAGITAATYSGKKAFDPFPCGDGPNGFTVCPEPVFDLDEPSDVEYAFIATVVDGDIPLADPVNFRTYSFVFDTDGDPFNDWVPIPEFPNDFFQDTDRWYQVMYSPDDGWELVCSQVTDGANQQVSDVATAANAMIVGNIVTLVVPIAELDNFAKGLESGFGIRYTSFRHTGDFGLNPPFDFNADVEPPVDEGLFRIP